MTPPDLDRTNALFLDLDGTLLEIAATPESVVVPPNLPGLLANLHALLGGAVAIVTGRSIGVVDSLLAPFSATAAGEHGVALRYQDGTVEEMPKRVAVPEAWREALAGCGRALARRAGRAQAARRGHPLSPGARARQRRVAPGARPGARRIIHGFT